MSETLPEKHGKLINAVFSEALEAVSECLTLTQSYDMADNEKTRIHAAAADLMESLLRVHASNIKGAYNNTKA